MDEERIDLSALRPDPDRWDRMVAGVVLRARLPAVAPAPRGPLTLLAGWTRPALAAAALVAGVSLATLAGLLPPRADAAGAPVLVSESLDIPAPAVDWLVEGRGPERRDVLVALDEMP